MGIEVVVDSDDLEKLLYATGCIKQIESALLNRSEDPFAQSAEAGLKSAHEKINKAWLNAKRNVVQKYDEPSKDDINLLRNLPLTCVPTKSGNKEAAYAWLNRIGQ